MNSTSIRAIARHFRAFAVAAILLLLSSQSRAGVLYFDATTDTVALSGLTSFGTTMTIEAVVRVQAGSSLGYIFNEWVPSTEDKQFMVAPNLLRGYAFPTGFPDVLIEPTTLDDGYHHVAFVHDVSEERLYVDGQQIASRALGGAIGNGGGAMKLGAIARDSMIASSFLGWLDSLRVSSTAVYSGTSFVAPTGDMSVAAGTFLLYNFNEGPGSTTLTDLSGNGGNGVLGVGFSEATSPEFLATPEPSSFVLLGLGGLAIAVRTSFRRRRRESTGLNEGRPTAPPAREGRLGRQND